MADRITYPIDGAKNEMQLLTARLTGAGAAALVNAEAAQPGAGEISAIVRTGVGAHTLTFRRKYPKLTSIGRPGHMGTTAGLQCRVLTWNPVTGTATVQLEVGTVATEAAATDTIFFDWIVRNSGAN